MKTIVKIFGIAAIAVCSTSASAQFLQGLIDNIKSAKDALVSQVPKSSTDDPKASLENPNKAVSKVAMAYTTIALKELEDGIGGGTINTKEMTFPSVKHAASKSICSFPSSTIEDLKGSFKESSGLLIPVYRLRRADIDMKSKSKIVDFGLVPDWTATERLHKSMTQTAKFRLLPLSETKKYDSLLQSHLSKTINTHVLAIFKSMGSDGGLLPMLAKMNEGNDASDVNRQIAGPFNEEYHANVLNNFQNASYLVSTSDSKVITAYFSTLIHYLAGSSTKFPAPRGEDLTEIRMIQGIWNSYLSSYGYLVGYANQKEAESAAIGSGSRLIKITSQSWITQWKVLAPELAAAGETLDTHALARSNHIGLLSITPVEVFSKMSALGFNSSKLQCVAFDTNVLSNLSKSGQIAMEIWNAVDKESNPIVGIFARGNQGNQPNEPEGHGCVGWGCTRTVDLVRDQRIKDLIAARDLIPLESKIVDVAKLNDILVDALIFTVSHNDISGAIDSKKLK